MQIPIPWTPLYPSQRAGTASRESAWWRANERDFIVQWFEDRVYFRLTDGEPTVWASLESCAQNEATTCFEEAVRTRRYGACFKSCVKLEGRRGDFVLLMHFIYAPDGTGWLREWSSREWIAFAPHQTRMWALFPDAELPRRGVYEGRNCCQHAANSVTDEILFRSVSDDEIERLSWRCATTPEEFKRTMLWLWRAGLLRFSPEQRKFASVSLNNCLPVYHPPDGDRQDKAWSSTLHLPKPCENANRELFDWLRGYFVGEGFEWLATGWGQRKFRKLRAQEPQVRAFFEPRPIYWGVRLSDQAEPSFHQQLEARLELRQWFQCKVSPEQADKWLAPQK